MNCISYVCKYNECKNNENVEFVLYLDALAKHMCMHAVKEKKKLPAFFVVNIAGKIDINFLLHLIFQQFLRAKTVERIFFYSALISF